jgi:uncharacterized membrane protein
MTMRLQELHPALVHYPISLLPIAVGADALGKVSGNHTLLQVGKAGIALAAGSAAIAGVAGLVAQEAVRLDEETHAMLATHRNLNLGVLALTSWMAVRRATRSRPTFRYLLAGAAGIAGMAYGAYLGGHMVYEHGVGVKAAGGLHEEAAPELTPERAGDAAAISGEMLRRGVRHAVTGLAEGEVVPYLRRAGSPDEEAGRAPGA